MRAIFLILLCGFMLQAQEQKRLKVVTTTGTLKYLAEQVGGDRVEVHCLVNPAQDPHYVIPTPQMSELANKADLFIEIGMNLDIWAERVITASGNPKIMSPDEGRLIASMNTTVLELPAEVSRAWGDIHPQGNPHIWLDPLNVKTMAENIANRLIKLDPDGTSYYRERLNEFKYRIDKSLFGEELLKEFGKKAGDILSRKVKDGYLEEYLQRKKMSGKLGGWLKKAQSIKGMKVISYHKTYIYFATRFGMEICGEIEEKPGIPPSAKHRDYITELVKNTGVEAILNDNFYPTSAAEYIANKTGAKIITTYIDVGASPKISTYEDLINYMLEQLCKIREKEK